MKRVLFIMLISIAAVTVSCKNSIDERVTNESIVTFAIEVPEMGTRTFGDGTISNDLYYGIYDESGNLINSISKINDENKSSINISTTINLKLVTGNTYSMIIWADNANDACEVDFAAKTMTFNPISANQEVYDAFWAYVEPFEVTSNMSKTVKLYRPFAQLNIGTDDILSAKNAGMEVLETKIAIQTPTILDLVSGDVSNEANVVYNFASIPTNETFPVEGYEYLSMNYLLIGTEKSTIDVEFGYSNGADEYNRTYTFVPVQRNYRTNIYGSLLTSSLDINIAIEPSFNEPNYNLNNNL